MPTSAARWLICTRDAESGRRLQEACSAQGVDAALLLADENAVPLTNERVLRSMEDLDRCMESIAAPDALVLLSSQSNIDFLEDMVVEGVLASGLLTSLERHWPQTRLWVLTRGAQNVVGTEAPRLSQAALWGWGRVAALEHPTVFGGVIDLDPADDDFAIPSLRAAMRDATSEDQISSSKQIPISPKLVELQ